MKQIFIVTIEARHPDTPTFLAHEVENALRSVYRHTFNDESGSHRLVVSERRPGADLGRAIDLLGPLVSGPRARPENPQDDFGGCPPIRTPQNAPGDLSAGPPDPPTPSGTPRNPLGTPRDVRGGPGVSDAERLAERHYEVETGGV
jgi:hypothetical protein